MTSVIPPSPVDESNTSSRPTSPAEEADETLTPTEEEEYKKMVQCRRKSSMWKKALNLKKQISKVNLKIGEGVRRGSTFFGPTEGTPLSPVEVSPQEITPSSSDIEQSEYIKEIERDIVQNLNDLDCNKEHTIEKTLDDHSESNTDRDSDGENERRLSSDSDIEWKKRIMQHPQSLQTRRSDAFEEVAQHMLPLQGSHQSRPSELPLFDDNGKPLAPPRLKPNEARNQRLLSVPNIKYQRKDSLRSTTDTSKPKAKKEPQPNTSFAGNLMRRFSKY